MFLALFTQGPDGFRQVIVAMGLLPAVIGLAASTPLVSAVVLLMQPVLLYYYRAGLEFKAISRLVLGALVGIPTGIYLLNRLPENILLPLLGLLLIGYGIYGLSPLTLPRFSRPAWAYLMGFVAGLFGGAYAVGGPPVVIYGHGRRWSPAEFKGNLQAYFILTSIGIVVGHVINGSYTPDLWPYFWAALPAAVLGLIAGLVLDRFVRPEAFRKLVLVGVIVLGVGLVIG
jgi:uncharacterized membrane protein YfcA